MQNFDQLLNKAASGKRFKVCVAAAEDRDVLHALKLASGLGFVEPVLVGDGTRLEALCKEVGLAGAALIDCPNPENCALEAVKQVRSGEADVLMKGTINTSDYLRAILNKEHGLRSGAL